MRNHYQTLHIEATASPAEIKAAYRTLAKKYHPDTNPNDTEAAVKFAEVNDAYDTLCDPEKRAVYDRQLVLEMLRERQFADAYMPQQDKSAAKNFPPPHSSHDPLQADFEALLQAEMQAAIQAEVQAEVHAQFSAVYERAYKEGYERGNKDGQAYVSKILSAQNETYRQKMNESRNDRADLEQELFDRDRELNKANETIRELNVQLEWLKKAAGDADIDPLRAPMENAHKRVRALEKSLAAIRILPADISGSATAAINQKRLELSNSFRVLNQTLEELETEINSLRAMNDRRAIIAQNEALLSSLEARAAQWAKKCKEDQRAAKSTLYGTLGVLMWATAQQITDAYNLLMRQCAEKKDADSARKIQKIKEAYATLSDPEKRRKYNAAIGITNERIQKERERMKENERVQEDYRNKLATRMFWTLFDELSSLALSGDADAQNALGTLYMQGDKVERDYAQAAYWFREAAAQRHPAAIHNLGMCYLNGRGVRRNKAIGFSYLRQADNLKAPFADVRAAVRAR